MLRNGILFAGLFFFVLFLNKAVIDLDLLYAEQPMLFAANQSIQSLGDLFNIYLHPKMLDVFSIPFFRPSGHFLTYQLLMPLLGWHNTRGLIIINLLFLSLSGLVLIKVYELLFPRLKAGAYLAFTLYLMHPALMLSRLIVLHFEFAYVFFTLLSLYAFILFCRRIDGPLRHFQALSTRSFNLLFAALFFYVLAVTYKEPALMLGPALILYFCLELYQGQSFRQYAGLLTNKAVWQILLLILLVSLSLSLYLTLAWPTLAHPLSGMITTAGKIFAATELIKIILGIPLDHSHLANLYQPKLVWREVVFTPASRGMIWFLFSSLLICLLKMAVSGDMQKERGVYWKSLLFLFCAALLFLVLPINWAMGLPWHLSLTLLFLSLMLGFSCDYLSQAWIKNSRLAAAGVMAAALIVAFTTLPVNQANISYILTKNGFAFNLAHNAVFHPPAIKDKLNADSVLLVEDSVLHDSYALGNADYPYYVRTDITYDQLQKAQAFSFAKRQMFYNGTLFKWAYLMPELQEEVYAFNVNRLNEVPDAILHEWLRHGNNIFCVGYDNQAQWQDKTEIFRKNLLREQAKRYLHVHAYEPLAATTLDGKVLYTKSLNFPAYQLCQYECDQNKQCKGFTFENAQYHYQSKIKCQFYDAISKKDPKFCATCIGFVKLPLS